MSSATRTVAAATRWVAAVLLALYTVVIIRLTLRPATSETGIFDRLDRFMTHVSNGRLDWSKTEVLANVALFVPAGFLLAVVLGRAWAGIICCVLASVAIELAQQRYFPSRVPSIADVEHNGLGGAIGALLGWPVAYLARTSGRNARARAATHAAGPGSSRDFAGSI
jgi:glycopeptide antibiotics resistance protein